MRIIAKIIENGLIKPLNKVDLPLGIKIILSFELPKPTSLNHFKLVSQRTFGAMKDEDWGNLRKRFNQDFDKRLNKLWNVSN